MLSHMAEVKVEVAQSCQLWDPIDYRVHGTLQARILEWVAVPFSRGSSQPSDRAQVSCVAGGFFTSWATGKPKDTGVGSLLQWIFPTQESNWSLLHCRWVLYQLSYQGHPDSPHGERDFTNAIKFTNKLTWKSKLFGFILVGLNVIIWAFKSRASPCWRQKWKLDLKYDNTTHQSILREINPEHSLEGLKLKFQCFYWENTLMLGVMEGKRRKGRQWMRWLDGITDPLDVNLNKLQKVVKDREVWHAAVRRVAKNRT